ncbi:unnamed protein product [Peniophora sp. CBMAI 1063]|nr:unnamed protein product [Peniophora sp. CBMAI 1063]
MARAKTKPSASQIAKAQELLQRAGLETPGKTRSSLSTKARGQDAQLAAAKASKASKKKTASRHRVPYVSEMYLLRALADHQHSWQNKKWQKLTDYLIRRLKDKPQIRVAFGLEKGDGATPSSAGMNKQDFGEALAPYVFEKKTPFAAWPLEVQGTAIVNRIDVMKKKYIKHHTDLGETGQGLVDKDKEDEIWDGSKIANIWDKICRNFPWYKDMDELMRRSPALTTKAVTNSQSPVKTGGIRGMKGGLSDSDSSEDEDDEDDEDDDSSNSDDSMPDPRTVTFAPTFTFTLALPWTDPFTVVTFSFALAISPAFSLASSFPLPLRLAVGDSTASTTPSQSHKRARSQDDHHNRDRGLDGPVIPRLFASPTASPRRSCHSAGATVVTRSSSGHKHTPTQRPSTPAPSASSLPKKKGLAAIGSDIKEAVEVAGRSRVESQRVKTELHEKNKFDMEKLRLEFQAVEAQKQRDFQREMMDRELALLQARRGLPVQPIAQPNPYAAADPYDPQAPTAPYLFIDPNLH